MLRKDKAIEIANNKMIEYEDDYKFRYLGTKWSSNYASWCSYYVFTKKDYMHELVICADPLFKSTEVFSSGSEEPGADLNSYLGQDLAEEDQNSKNQYQKNQTYLDGPTQIRKIK